MKCLDLTLVANVVCAQAHRKCEKENSGQAMRKVVLHMLSF